MVIRLGKQTGLRLGESTTRAATSDDIIRIKPVTKKKKTRRKIESILIGQAALLSGGLAGLGAGIINPALAVPAFLTTTAGVASLLAPACPPGPDVPDR